MMSALFFKEALHAHAVCYLGVRQVFWQKLQ